MKVKRVSIFGSGSGNNVDLEEVLAGRGLFGDASGETPVLFSQFDIKEFQFNYSIEPATVLFTAIVNERIKRVAIEIVTPFNNGAATLSVGHSGNPNALMGATENDANEVGLYITNPEIKYGGNELIRLYMNAAGSTAGAGYCFIESEITGDSFETIPQAPNSVTVTYADFFRTQRGFEGKVSDVTPAPPDEDYSRIYPKSDGWYFQNEDGVETKIGTGATGGGGSNSYFPGGWA